MSSDEESSRSRSSDESRTSTEKDSSEESESSDDSVNYNDETLYSSRLRNMTSKQKIDSMDKEIMTLKHHIKFLNFLKNMKAEGTTKRGRITHRLGSNRSIMTSIRDVMADVIFPYCKFIGKMDLQTTAVGSIADVLMKNLKVGGHLKRDDNAKMKFRLEWWGRNCELVEKCLVDHKTKATQNLKKRYLSGKSLSFVFNCLFLSIKLKKC